MYGSADFVKMEAGNLVSEMHDKEARPAMLALCPEKVDLSSVEYPMRDNLYSAWLEKARAVEAAGAKVEIPVSGPSLPGMPTACTTTDTPVATLKLLLEEFAWKLREDESSMKLFKQMRELGIAKASQDDTHDSHKELEEATNSTPKCILQ